MQHHLVFVRMKYFFVLHQLFFSLHETFFRATSTRFCQHQNTFCATSNFLLQHKIIFHQIFILDIVYNVMLWWYIFIVTTKIYHVSKNFIFMWHKKINFVFFFFLHHNFSIFIFYITHCQHVDLRRGDPENKKTFNPPFTHLSDIPKQLLTKSCSWKKVSYCLGSMFVKRLRGAHSLAKLQACFSQILQKLTP